jgi:putative peptide zinc metalloprotease protein
MEAPAPDAAAVEELRPDVTQVRGTPPGATPPGLQEPPAGPTLEESGPPQLAEGIEFLGEFKGSGFKDPPYLLRRADGQVIQIPQLLYAVAERANGSRDYETIASEVTEEFGRGLSAENVQYLAEEKLRPLGILAGLHGETPKVEKANPLLALDCATCCTPPA